MDFLIILIDLVVIALGIVDVRFGFICRREQHQNKMNAQIYVGDGKSNAPFTSIVAQRRHKISPARQEFQYFRHFPRFKHCKPCK